MPHARLTIPLLVLVCLLGPVRTGGAQETATTAAGQGGPVLFQDFRFNDPRQDLTGRPGMYDCSADLGAEALCLDGVEYLGRDWAADFAFSRGRLIAVGLVRPFDRSLYLDAFAAVTKYSALVAMETEDQTLDLIRLLAENTDGQRFSDTVTAFEADGMEASRLAYIFLDKRSIATAAGKAGDLDTLTAWADPAVVRTVLVLYSEGANGGQGPTDWLALLFQAPRLLPNP